MASQQERDENIVQDAISYAVTNGLIMVQSTPTAGTGAAGDDGLGIRLIHAPFTLNASYFDKKSFETAQRTAPMFSMLIHRMSTDPEFIRQALQETVKYDSFQAKLLDTYNEAIDKHGLGQTMSLGIHRYDYFMERTKDGKGIALRQVELNTISASFGCLGSRIGGIHDYVRRLDPSLSGINPSSVFPQNHADQGIVRAIALAHDRFKSIHAPSEDKDNVRVLMIVQPGERNRFDQDILRSILLNQFGVRSVRISMEEIAKNSVIDPKTKNLIIRQKENEALNQETTFTASVAYFRAGYTPNDYPTESCWKARLLLEISTPIKCPSLAYQLLGAKKVQQLLYNKDLLKRFVPDNSELELIHSCFATQWSLSNMEEEERALFPSSSADLAQTTTKTIAMALENPHDYVLKPQREGGGNNLYNDELKNALMTMSRSDLAAYILMARINPIEVPNIIVRRNKFVAGSVVGELGIFGTFLGNSDKSKPDVYHNEYAGSLLRSKLATVDDGGVAAGVAVLDSLHLIEGL